MPAAPAPPSFDAPTRRPFPTPGTHAYAYLGFLVVHTLRAIHILWLFSRFVSHPHFLGRPHSLGVPHALKFSHISIIDGPHLRTSAPRRQARAHVIVLAATNRPDRVDAALLRPGRFDRLLHVPPPDVAGRAAVLRVHTRRTPLAGDVDLDELAAVRGGMEVGGGEVWVGRGRGQRVDLCERGSVSRGWQENPATCVDGNLCGWQLVWMATWMDNNLCGWQLVWMTTCVDGNLYGWRGAEGEHRVGADWRQTGRRDGLMAEGREGFVHAWMEGCMEACMNEEGGRRREGRRVGMLCGWTGVQGWDELGGGGGLHACMRACVHVCVVVVVVVVVVALHSPSGGIPGECTQRKKI
eukprot:203629-Chlamydomonas_euryale.AAC.1